MLRRVVLIEYDCLALGKKENAIRYDHIESIHSLTQWQCVMRYQELFVAGTVHIKLTRPSDSKINFLFRLGRIVLRCVAFLVTGGVGYHCFPSA